MKHAESSCFNAGFDKGSASLLFGIAVPLVRTLYQKLMTPFGVVVLITGGPLTLSHGITVENHCCKFPNGERHVLLRCEIRLSNLFHILNRGWGSENCQKSDMYYLNDP
jgi:hypothetical protein